MSRPALEAIRRKAWVRVFGSIGPPSRLVKTRVSSEIGIPRAARVDSVLSRWPLRTRMADSDNVTVRLDLSVLGSWKITLPPGSVGNQHKWDSLGPERSDVWKSLGELPEGPVMKSSPIDGLGLHLDGGGLADF